MKKLLLLIALPLAATVAPATTFFDGFNVAAPAVSVASGSAKGSAVSLSDGIQRILTTGVESNAAPKTNRAWSSVADGFYTFGSDVGVDGWGQIDYRFGGLDLRGITALQIDFTATSATTFGLTLGDANTDVMLRPMTAAASATRTVLDFQIPDYVAEDLDLQNLTTMSLWVDTGAAGKVQIGGLHPVRAVAPVPEPASLAVLGLGGLALLRRRRA